MQDEGEEDQRSRPEAASGSDLTEAAWRALRFAYENGTESVEALKAEFGVSKDRLYRRAATEGWVPRRSPADPRTRKPQQAVEPEPTSKRAELAARLFHALEERILAIEEETFTTDATHSERDAKALTAMARALDMLSEMLEHAEARDGGNAGAKPPTEEVDVDEFRYLLADRLDRLRRSKLSDGSVGEPVG